MISTLLWDIDNTLLDFFAAEAVAIRNCFARFELGECTDEMLERYSEINTGYWKRLERGEITKPEVLIGRFLEFFEKEGLPTEKAEAFNDLYQILLGDTCVFMDESDRLIRELKAQGFRQYAASNGTAVAQHRKLANSGFDKLFDAAFISDEIGFEKPTAEFFDAAFKVLGEDKRDETLMIGDSLTSDMRGGVNAGILTCWYNPRHETNNTDVTPDYEVDDLRKIPGILEELNRGR